MLFFKKIEIQNFMSFGDTPVTVLLDKTNSTLITGHNGTGKSSFAEAITFALFGKSFRGVNKSDLVNRINGQCCKVVLWFDKNNDGFVVTRGIMPNIFTIEKNGHMLDELSTVKDFQIVLENIIGFCYADYIKTVLIGHANYKPMLQLNSTERRQFIDSLLDIKVYTDMGIINKTNISNWNMAKAENKIKKESAKQILEGTKKSFEKVKKFTEDSITELELKIEITKSEIDLIENLQYQTFEPRYPSIAKELNELNGQLTGLEIQYANIKRTVDELVKLKIDLGKLNQFCDNFVMPDVADISSDYTDYENELTILSGEVSSKKCKMSAIQQDIMTIRDRIEFFKTQKTCDVCSQTINSCHSEDIISAAETKLNSLVNDYNSLQSSVYKLLEEKIANTKLLKKTMELEKKHAKEKNDFYNKKILQFNIANTKRVEIANRIEKNSIVNPENLLAEADKNINHVKERLYFVEKNYQFDLDKRTKIEHHNAKVTENKLEKRRKLDYLIDLTCSFDSLKSKDYMSQFIKEVDEATALEAELKLIENALIESKTIIDISSVLLKDDGIKSHIVKLYMPTLNQLINEYLFKLGAGYQIIIDENFNDVIIGGTGAFKKGGVITYNSLSQGERQRVDIACMAACRKISQICSGADVNILILDEVGDSSMDADGIESLFQIIDGVWGGLNVFFISHRLEMQGKCNSTIQLVSENGFTKII